MPTSRSTRPTEIAFPKVDAVPIWALSAAIFKDAPHTNAARLFIAWYLAPEQQKRTGTWSPRSDVPAPNGWKPILSYKVVNDYRAFITNDQLIKDLRARFGVLPGPDEERRRRALTRRLLRSA